MAKRKYIDYKKAQSDLFRRTEGYAANVRSTYQSALLEIIGLVKDTELKPGKPFSFSEYGYSDKVTPLLRNMYSRVYQTIRTGVEKEWLTANEHNDGLVKAIFGEHSIEDNHFAKYFQRNMEAMDAFFARKTGTGGLNLSQKVWKYTGIYKDELEDALDLAIGEGTPANRLATRIQKYLNEPDRFYRRFRVKVGENEDGTPQYGRIWKRRIFDSEANSYKWIDDDPRKYHPGRGVYRSSYRNAQRLARTETNIAYRTSDYERWQQMDFIVGIEIKMSGNHPFEDICDELQGRYPKDFKWTGWHPNCRCYQVPVIATPSEIDQMLDNILEGKAPADEVECSDEVTELPTQFKGWLSGNEERVKAATENGTLPYFVKDNRMLINGTSVIPTDEPENKVAEHVNRVRYNRYDDSWEKYKYDNESNGFIVIHKSRLPTDKTSKNDILKFEKELSMCSFLANKGYRIELLNEIPGIPSPDITLNGILADLKKLSSHNNIAKEAKSAVRKQHAELVIFEFPQINAKILWEISKLSKIGVSGKYYQSGTDIIFDF